MKKFVQHVRKPATLLQIKVREENWARMQCKMVQSLMEHPIMVDNINSGMRNLIINQAAIAGSWIEAKQQLRIRARKPKSILC
jgi:protein involved in temperature-dependent protein secretion